MDLHQTSMLRTCKSMLSCSLLLFVFLVDCGSVFSWGNSEYSQVGFPTKESLISTPTKLSSLENVIDIAIGGSVGLALTVKGEVFSWGYGLLGNDVNACFRATPQKVETYFDECVVKVASGLDFHVMLTENGNLYAWGRLGGDTTSRTPEQVILPSKVVRVSCGFDTMAIFTED